MLRVPPLCVAHIQCTMFTPLKWNTTCSGWVAGGRKEKKCSQVFAIYRLACTYRVFGSSIAHLAEPAMIWLAKRNNCRAFQFLTMFVRRCISFYWSALGLLVAHGLEIFHRNMMNTLANVNGACNATDSLTFGKQDDCRLVRVVRRPIPKWQRSKDRWKFLALG